MKFCLMLRVFVLFFYRRLQEKKQKKKEKLKAEKIEKDFTHYQGTNNTEIARHLH